MEEIREAARIACVDDAVMSFPDGYETLVGERGVTFQEDRGSVSPLPGCFFRKRRSWYLTIPFSAVDSETDHKIRQALKECMKNTQ